MKRHTPASPNSRTALRSKPSRKKQAERKLETYCKVVHYLLEAYITNEVIFKIHVRIMKFTQRLSKTWIEYDKILLIKASHCCQKYVKYVLNSNIIECVQDSICQNMCSF